MSEHHTVGSVSSSLLPTVTASDYKRDGSSASQLGRKSPAVTVVAAHFPMLPTPNAGRGSRGASHPDSRRAKRQTVNLEDAAYVMGNNSEPSLLPTSNTMDHREVRTGYQREKQLHRGDFNSPKRSSMGNLREDIVIAREGDSGSPYGRYDQAVRRWETVFREAPHPTFINSKGNERLSAAFAEWMMGLPEGWVTSPEIGLSRAQQLKAIGNGVCPQQAYAALSVLVPRLCGEELANAG